LRVVWNPSQYLKFGGERLRPAHDLLARLAIDSPRTIVDLGCGTGTVTALLRERWPDAQITGVDNSQPMLDRARAEMPDVTWQFANLATWIPPAPVDLMVSNAALQWLDDHATLFPRLLTQLSLGGTLAVQMPAQHAAPSHRIGYEVADDERWHDRLKLLVRRRPILDAAEYYALMRPHVSTLDLWFTEYIQRLTGDNPVVEFTKGSFVGAWLSALAADEAREFESEYGRRIAAAYPALGDGVTLFPFRRFFVIAQR
jgi:trans-aconitate 2-methyltransferase